MSDNSETYNLEEEQDEQINFNENPYAFDMTLDNSSLEQDLNEKMKDLAISTHRQSTPKFMPYCT